LYHNIYYVLAFDDWFKDAAVDSTVHAGVDASRSDGDIKEAEDGDKDVKVVSKADEAEEEEEEFEGNEVDQSA
jgi:hypothetical protein